MREDSQAAHEIKAQITAYASELTGTLKRPAAKFVFQMLHGMVASGSLHLSKIGRGVQGKESLVGTIKRLSRQLRDAARLSGADRISGDGTDRGGGGY